MKQLEENHDSFKVDVYTDYFNLQTYLLDFCEETAAGTLIFFRDDCENIEEGEDEELPLSSLIES